MEELVRRAQLLAEVENARRNRRQRAAATASEMVRQAAEAMSPLTGLDWRAFEVGVEYSQAEHAVGLTVAGKTVFRVGAEVTPEGEPVLRTDWGRRYGSPQEVVLGALEAIERVITLMESRP